MEQAGLSKLQPHRNLTETVYDALKGAIIDGSLATGYRLTEASLASTFAVSTTPIREALTRLEREGLVSLLARRGAVVVSFTADDVREVAEVRELLEAFAVRKAIERATPEMLARLRAIVEECQPFVEIRDQRSFNRLDVEFHRLIVQTSGNRRLIRLFEMLHDQFQIIRLRVVQARGRPRVPHGEHVQIMAAIVAGDASEAERLLCWHIRHAASDLVGAGSTGTGAGAANVIGA